MIHTIKNMSLFFLTHTFICAHKLFFFAVNKIIFVNVCVLRSPPCTHVYRGVLRDCTHVYRGLPRLYTCVQGVQHTHTHTHTQITCFKCFTEKKIPTSTFLFYFGMKSGECNRQVKSNITIS